MSPPKTEERSISQKSLISVIVANYNNAKYLPQCIDSILRQTYPNIEIVIADDCSTDSSVDIIRDYSKKHSNITPIFNEINLGVAANRHKAITHASGDYITTLDSDDVFINARKLEMEFNLIQEKKKSENKDVIAFSKVAFLNEKGKYIDEVSKYYESKEGFILEDVILRNCEIPHDFFMRKEIYFEAGGYDSEFLIYEDWDLKIRLSSLYDFNFTGIVGTGLRLHGKGLSSAPVEDLIKFLRMAFDKNISLLPAGRIDEVRNKFQIKLMEIEKYERNRNSFSRILKRFMMNYPLLYRLGLRIANGIRK